MLVLTRKQRENVIIADEITVTVENISDADGNYVMGARVRLGFECPEHVMIDRGELRRRGQGAKPGGKRREPEPPPPGRARDLSNGQVQLRVEVPRMVPVCVNGAPVLASDPEAGGDRTDQDSTVLHRVVCTAGDRLTICHNIVVQPVSFQRFELYDAPAAGG